MRSLSHQMTSPHACGALSVDNAPQKPPALSKRAQCASSSSSCETSGMRLTFHLLILNNSNDSVLASEISQTQLRLPHVRPLIRQLYYMDVSVRCIYELHHWEVESCALEHFVQTQLHIRFHTLQTIRYHPAPSIRLTQQSYEPQVMVLGVAETMEPLYPPLRWVKRSQLSDYQWGRVLDGVDVKSQIHTVLECINRNPLVTHSAPWFWHGCVEAMQSWVRRELAAQQLLPVVPFQLICSTGEVCVFKCRVSRIARADKHGRTRSSKFDVFVKAVRSPSQEPYRVAAIASLLPKFVPHVIAIHGKHNAMIQKSAGTPLDASTDPCALIQTLAQLHISSLSHIAKLKASGLPVLDSYWFSAKFDSIMHHPALLCMESYADVQQDIRYIRANSALVRELCDEISKVSVPHSLVHGDLKVHNIAFKKSSSGQQYRFFDWGSSFIGHPFYDLRTLLEDERNRSLINMADDRLDCNSEESYVVQYLSAWKSNGTVADLKNVYDLMDILRHGIELYRLTQLYENYNGIERRKLIPRIHSEIRGLRIMIEEFATCTATSSF